MFASDAPVGKQLQLAPQHRVVVRRQRVARHLGLPLHERGNGVAHQRVGLLRAGVGKRIEIERAAEVGEQQEAALDVGSQHLRPVQAGLLNELRDLDEGPHVFLRRRRVHDHQARPRACVDAQVAAKARIGRRSTQGVAAQSVLRCQRRQPALEVHLALRVGPGDLDGR
jgi:hypothetical protein